MSSLSSNFQVLSGLPSKGKGAMQMDFPQKSGESPVLSAGMIVKVENATGSPVVTKLTSANLSTVVLPDDPWLVIRGYDQPDSSYDNHVTCIRMKTGVIWQADVANAALFAIGDDVYANAGVVTKVAGTQQQVGQVIGVDTTNDIIVVASGNKNV